ncbi:MAG: 2-phospho-L-lactate guanylyltransferase [Bauldia litoralis]
MTPVVPWCVVPIKRREAAKQRLASLLGPVERADLAEAMVRDVLAALSAVRGLSGVMLVTGDDGFAALGQHHGFRVLADPTDDGTTAAVARAAATLVGERAASMLVLHADLPLATPQAIEGLLSTAAEGPPLTLVPDRRRRGTNAMVARPVDLVPFCFGAGSYHLHQRAAEARGIGWRGLDVPELAHDIDRPDDLASILDQDGATGRYLARSGIGARFRATVDDPEAVQ